jgi:hypothetical protein
LFDSTSYVETDSTTNNTTTSNVTTDNTNTNTSTINSTNTNTNTNNNTSTITSTNTNNNTNTNTNTNTNNTTIDQTTDSTVNQTVNQTTSSTINQTVNSTSNITTDNTNRNINTSTSTNTNNNTNNTTIDSTATNTNNNTNNSTINQRVETPPPSAIAPSIQSGGNDTCTVSYSASVQTQILGASGGGHVRDLNCERLKNAKTLYNMGMKVAAVSLMCQDEGVFKAMEMAGTPCPFDGSIGPTAQALWDNNPDMKPVDDGREPNDTQNAIIGGSILLALLLAL